MTTIRAVTSRFPRIPAIRRLPRSCRAQSPDGVRQRRTRWLRYAWGLVWAAITLRIVRTGADAGGIGVLGAVCAAVACLTLFALCTRSLEQVAQGARLPDRMGRWLLALGAAATVGAVVGVGPQGLQMETLLAVAVALALPWRVSVGVVVALALAVVAPQHLLGWPETTNEVTAVLGAGIACAFGRRSMVQRRRTRLLQERNHQLEINEERNRMARDLHDILGHSLTVISIKSELAGKLVDASPEAARKELAEVQSLARSALADARAVVNDYRELSLAGELARAASALDAAGVRADLPLTADDVDPELRELFAWVVREAVTNVVRHAGASRCTVRLEPQGISVVDDGVGIAGASPGADGGGHGLEGLRQRCEAAGADLDLSPGPGGRGTVLRVSARELAPTGPAARVQSHTTPATRED